MGEKIGVARRIRKCWMKSLTVRYQEGFLKDGDYRKLSEMEKEAAVSCYRELPEEYHDLVESLMDCHNSCCGKLIELAYKQGMKDCARLLEELNLK